MKIVIKALDFVLFIGVVLAIIGSILTGDYMLAIWQVLALTWAILCFHSNHLYDQLSELFSDYRLATEKIIEDLIPKMEKLEEQAVELRKQADELSNKSNEQQEKEKIDVTEKTKPE